MGTSKAYTPTPNWSGIKTEITWALKPGTPDGERSAEIVNDFIQKLVDDPNSGFGDLPPDFGKRPEKETSDKLDDLLKGLPVLPARKVWVNQVRAGSRSRSSGSADKSDGDGRARGPKSSPKGGRGGGITKVVGGSSVRPAATRLASFISAIPKVGLRQALTDAGVSVDNLPPEKIALAIADVLAADPALTVDVELRAALARVMREICKDAASLEDAETALVDSAYGLEQVVERLFECYIMEHFKSYFEEHEDGKYGDGATDKLLNEARKFVQVELQIERAERRDLTQVEWGKEEGTAIVNAILEKTISVFGGDK